jgi:rubrerythrin
VDIMTELPEEAVGVRILRLLAVERGLQDEGQGNAARLFRAAALREALRATRVHPRLGRGLEQAATDIIAELRAAGSEALAALMDQALATISSGGWPTRAQIPPTFVCRDCGEVMLGNPPPTCPVCRARALTFHEIGPFYWELLDVAHVLPALAASVTEVEVICAGVTEAQARSGPWPMREIVAHLLGAERLAVGRAVRVIEEDDPELASVSWTVTVADEPGSMADLVARLREHREQTLSRFGALASEQWRRAGHHPEWGRLTVHRLLSQLARHEQGHLAELEARRDGR